MDNQNNIPAGQHRGTVNGQQGTWVPVNADSVPFPVTGTATSPSLGQDGNYYYAQGGNSTGGFGPIAANQYNAIPTPSNIVQLPPIVQPIALVPFASQNQPLVQYDSTYREEIQRTNLEPIYRAKAFTGVSLFGALIGVVAIVIMLVLACAGTASALDTILGLLAVAGLGTTSVYHTEVLSEVFTDGFASGFAADSGAAIMGMLVPILYIVAIVCALIAIIYFLVKAGQKTSPGRINVFTLIALVASVVSLIIMLIAKNIKPGIGAYVTIVVFAIMFIIPFFTKKGAQEIDYAASKRLYGGNN